MFNNIKDEAGVDLAYWNELGIKYAVCCVVVIDYNTFGVLEKAHTVSTIKFPHIPGCLDYRELPIVI